MRRLPHGPGLGPGSSRSTTSRRQCLRCSPCSAARRARARARAASGRGPRRRTSAWHGPCALRGPLRDSFRRAVTLGGACWEAAGPARGLQSWVPHIRWEHSVGQHRGEVRLSTHRAPDPPSRCSSGQRPPPEASARRRDVRLRHGLASRARVRRPRRPPGHGSLLVEGPERTLRKEMYKVSGPHYGVGVRASRRHCGPTLGDRRPLGRRGSAMHPTQPLSSVGRKLAWRTAAASDDSRSAGWAGREQQGARVLGEWVRSPTGGGSHQNLAGFGLKELGFRRTSVPPGPFDGKHRLRSVK